MKLTLRIAVACLLISILAGCGLTTSNEERLERAAVAMDDGEYRTAAIELRNVLGTDPDNAAARLMLATVSLGLGDIETADKELSRAAELGAPEADVMPMYLRILAAEGRYTDMLASLGMETGGLTETDVLLFRGQALLGVGNAEAALENYQQWLSLDPASADALVGQANATAVLGNVDSAIAMLEELVATDLEHMEAWQALGAMQYQQGLYDAAEQSLAKAADLSQPQVNVFRHASILAGLTETQLVLRRHDDARLNLNRLSGVAPESPITLLLGARLARAEGDYALAARQLQMLLNISPDNTQAQLFLANVQMMQGNYAQAENLLNRVVASSPANMQARKLLAQVQLRRAEPQGAIEALAPLLEDDSSADAELYNLLAYIRLQQGDAEAAIEQFRAAVDLDASDMQAKINLAAAYIAADQPALALEAVSQVPAGAVDGYARERITMLGLDALGRRDEADELAETLLRDHAADPDVATLIADYYFRQERFAAARQVLDDYLASQGSDVNVLNALGQVALEEEDLERAREAFTTVLSDSSGNPVALVGLARVAELAGDIEGQVRHLEQAARANPLALPPRAWLARVYYRTNRREDAERVADEMLSIGFDSPAISHVVGEILMASGRADEGLAQLERAVRGRPDLAVMRLSLAQAYMTFDRTVDAKTELEAAIAARPAWPPAMSMLALIELRQGRPAEAMAIVRELQSAWPGNAGAMVLEGEILSYQNDHEGAALAYERAAAAGAGRNAVLLAYQARVDGGLSGPDRLLRSWLESNPDDTLARSFLAQHLQRGDDGGGAIREYDRVLEQDPDNAAVLNNIAWLEQQAGNLERAVELAERARQLAPDSGAIADTLGWIYRDLGDLEQSARVLTEASRLEPGNGEIRFHLATVLAESGNEDDARQLLQTLIQEDVAFPSRQAAEALLREL